MLKRSEVDSAALRVALDELGLKHFGLIPRKGGALECLSWGRTVTLQNAADGRLQVVTPNCRWTIERFSDLFRVAVRYPVVQPNTSDRCVMTATPDATARVIAYLLGHGELEEIFPAIQPVTAQAG